MVFIWPWKSEDHSPASFEKTLSTLSTRITNATTRLDILRQRSRRFNLLWILYSSFAYLLYSIILAFVVGWRNCGLVETGAVFGGPVLIYAVRLGLIKYYNYRTSKLQTLLDELQKQRDTTIEKLKSATKYNTTQELLKKYGGSPIPKTKSVGASEGKPTPKGGNSGTPNSGRTLFAPPPTANIPGRAGPLSLPGTPQQSSPLTRTSSGQTGRVSNSSARAPSQQPITSLRESADFAPNAFAAAPQYARSGEGPRWLDRLVDVLLGEDESLPKNRLALICRNCRLVNGQAPPGAKRPEDVGRWRCGECGTLNGEEMEATKLVGSTKEEANSKTQGPVSKKLVQASSEDMEMYNVDAFIENVDGEESDITQYSEPSSNEIGPSPPNEIIQEPLVETDAPRRRVGRPKGSKNKPR
ncbi:hypothetical protein MMC07_001791 [Pseudocyphellaria aurata]|nr:hypothetical protein [Pseudocyphellaria aurata]